MKNVFIYCRVSTQEQVSGGGFVRQEEICRKFAEARGWTVMRVFHESQSGSDEFQDRAGLSQAVLLASEGLAHAILVERADRIARDVIVSELFLREMRKRKIEVYSADYGEEMVNSNGNETQVLIRQILAVLSQWEKSQIVKKLQAGRRRKSQETGEPCGGPKTYGYRHQEWPGVRLIIQMYRNGQSSLDIAETMSARTKEYPLGYPKPFMKRKKSRFPSWTWHPYTISRIIDYWDPRLNANLERRIDKIK